jgi:hypothetical protein
VTKVVGPASQLGAVLLVCQRGLTRPVPGSPEGDGGKRTTLDSLEERVPRLTGDAAEVFAEQLGQWWRARDAPSLALGPVLESSQVTAGPVIGPATAYVGPGGS